MAPPGNSEEIYSYITAEEIPRQLPSGGDKASNEIGEHATDVTYTNQQLDDGYEKPRGEY